MVFKDDPNTDEIEFVPYHGQGNGTCDENDAEGEPTETTLDDHISNFAYAFRRIEKDLPSTMTNRSIVAAIGAATAIVASEIDFLMEAVENHE